MSSDAVPRPADALKTRVARRRLLKAGAAAGAATALGVGSPALAREVAPVPSRVAPNAASPPAEQEPERIIVSANPLNAETPLWALEGLMTPTRIFFIRDHFAPGPLAPTDWQVRVEGVVEEPFTLTYDMLRRYPPRRLVALLECAGNSRSRFQPPAEGGQWGNGGVSVAEWIGVPLGFVLDLAGVKPEAQNVVVYGGERGNFARGLPMGKAYDPDTVLAYAMNGEPLPAAHGAPVRLVVPGWIGVASVKWIGRIEIIDRPYEGFYNTQRYVFERPGVEEKTPVVLQGVKSAIARPRPGETLKLGLQMISGYAWSGSGPITEVEVTVDNWQTSMPARLIQSEHRWAWTRFEANWDGPSGRYTLASQATDSAGNVQPEQVEWNRFGYGMNAIYSFGILVA